MSTFRVPVAAIRSLEAIKKADRIELAVVGDFRTVVRKGQFQPGDLVAYLPEASVVPEWLLRRMGLFNEFAGLHGLGLLSGPRGDRVHPQHMRGCLTEGLAYGLQPGGMLRLGPGVPAVQVAEGCDVASLLGVTKYSPPIPDELLGAVVGLPGYTLRYDIENRRSYPDVLAEGEPVAYSEKIHGHFCVLGVIPGLAHPELFHGGDVFVASKQLYGEALVFCDSPVNVDNLYVQGLRMLEPQVAAVRAAAADPASDLCGGPVHVMGELYGIGSKQKLKYGETSLRFRGFDVWVGPKAHGRFLGVGEKRAFMSKFGFDEVTFLYTGPHSQAEMLRHRDGMTVTGNGAHIREGIVIVPLAERRDNEAGRVCFKEVSPAYSGITDGNELN